MEDLWAFNDEALARAVYASAIPVVSAVGHETDFTICDFAADLRAPTPSAAAELCTPDCLEELARIAAYHRYFLEESKNFVAALRQSVDILTQDSPLQSPAAYVQACRDKLSGLTKALLEGQKARLDKSRGELSGLAGRLDALSPLRVLSRGYVLVRDEKGQAVTDVGTLRPGQQVAIRGAEASALAEILKVGAV